METHSFAPRRTFLRSGLAVIPAALMASLARAQYGPPGPKGPVQPIVQFPEKDAILKVNYEENIKDARALTALSKSIEQDFDTSGQNVMPPGMLKKLDDVEKITKRMRKRAGQ